MNSYPTLGAALVPRALALAGCGGPNPEDPSDGEVTADARDSGVVVAPPDIPWLSEGVPPIAPPMVTPCPAGWHEVLDEDPEGGLDLVTCDPYGIEPGGTEPDACSDGWVHFAGDDGCSSVGAPCPPGDFPEGLPTDAPVLYVLSSALPGGDGTRGSPLRAITDALNRAPAGTVIAIGKGVYDEALRLTPGVTQWGACAAETRITASAWELSAQGVITVGWAWGRGRR